MTHIWVRPGGDDRLVPVEGLRGVYFEHGVSRHVRDTPYIQRRLADGDLVPGEPSAAATAGEHEEHA